MTHNDIYTKFMIEYDKANVTSSYPSLTKYEVATILDKAYNALIAQKVTGNNIRRAYFEADTKAISDIAPLVKFSLLDVRYQYLNVTSFQLPTDFAYFVSASLEYNMGKKKPMDGNIYRDVPVKLIPHNLVEKFIASSYNMPWIKNPVCCIENGMVKVIYDPVDKPEVSSGHVKFIYVKQPKSFVENINNTSTSFELSDTMANELISLAVAFALDNVESTRLNSKLNMRGLEA